MLAVRTSSSMSSTPISLALSTLLPLMRARRTGTILFIGSGSYSGTKGLIEALVPSLALEVAPFGIRTWILVFCFFRMAVFTPDHMFCRAPNPLPEYAEINALIRGYDASVSGTEPRDPKKGCELVVEAVRSEKAAATGSDGFKFVRDDGVKKMRICDEWEGITSQTDCDWSVRLKIVEALLLCFLDWAAKLGSGILMVFSTY
ncbi:uncharacterized protein N7459_008298 [Penicillium hispanicum]|uniref:uncharacterized protein n=1 Tax=Penicillium hispanicum TaxID=1080232 RepID=UPI00254164DF|nr:uncharacterized protein N7459_008298 [Penicillium hispanicum]KAJ5573871.1 hypothetical protein N7459_008298 [Penicillium hispanicum]